MTLELLRPGLRHSESLLIDQAHTVPAMTPLFADFADMPPVFATAYLVAFVEWTCMRALAPFLEPGQRSVGTHVNLSHGAATPIGMRVTAEVELTDRDNRKMLFHALCRDERERIGEGMHERFIIDAERFADRLARKAAGAG